MRALGCLLIAGITALSACGGGDSGVSTRAEHQLELQVAGIRAAAAQADRNATKQQLALLRASVDQLAADDELTASAADRIRRAAATVEGEVRLLPAPTTTTTTTTTTTLPPPEDDERGNGKRWRDGKDRDEKDKDRGRGDDDED